ncbi:MAG: carbonic anhydrase [Candidatus Micrarchaeota archaeon]
MDPKQAMDRLMEGNKRFLEDKMVHKTFAARREELKGGQKPFATVVCCSDSRMVPEYTFDVGLGDIFTVISAGNVVDAIAIGSIEYAVAHLHTPVVVVLGHEKCGAVTAAYDKHREGNITAIMEKIEPAIAGVKRTDDKAADVMKCAEANVKAVIVEIMEKSEITRKAVESGKTKLVGAMYHFSDGSVRLLK